MNCTVTNTSVVNVTAGGEGWPTEAAAVIRDSGPRLAQALGVET